MESWRLVFREGFLPSLSSLGLYCLAQALDEDDPRLIQGATTIPAPLSQNESLDVEACCPVSMCGWFGCPPMETVGEVEEHFARSCFEADQRLGEPAACRWFLNWWDDTPRDVARAELLAEVKLALDERKARA